MSKPTADQHPASPAHVRVRIDGTECVLAAEDALELAADIMTAVRKAEQARPPFPSLAEWVASERDLVLD